MHVPRLCSGHRVVPATSGVIFFFVWTTPDGEPLCTTLLATNVPIADLICYTAHEVTHDYQLPFTAAQQYLNKGPANQMDWSAVGIEMLVRNRIQKTTRHVTTIEPLTIKAGQAAIFAAMLDRASTGNMNDDLGVIYETLISMSNNLGHPTDSVRLTSDDIMIFPPPHQRDRRYGYVYYFIGAALGGVALRTTRHVLREVGLDTASPMIDRLVGAYFSALIAGGVDQTLLSAMKRGDAGLRQAAALLTTPGQTGQTIPVPQFLMT